MPQDDRRAAMGGTAAAGTTTRQADDPWTIGRMLKWTTGYLQAKGDEHPRLSAEWLINNVTGLSRVQIYMSFSRVMTPDELTAMHNAVVRRAKGEPLQYVTGEMPFRHIVLHCERGVLIPRPETEVLVDAALEGVDAAIDAGVVYDDVRRRAAQKDDEAKADAVQTSAQRAEGSDSASSSSRGETSGLEYGRPLGRALSSFRGDPTHDSASEDDSSQERIDPIVHVAGPEQSHVPTYVPGPEDSLSARAERQQEEAAAVASDEPAPKPLGTRVLEVGCGTGCIALSIAGERPGTHVVTTDLSDQAVRLAARNRDALDLQDAVDVVRCDLAAGVDPALMGTFAVLVSNPPYIPSSVVPTLPQEVVGYEPGLALDGGPDGLDVFRRILEVAPRVLRPGGMLCCELFETNVQQAADLVMAQPGWASAEVRQDLTHRPRVLVARRAGSLSKEG